MIITINQHGERRTHRSEASFLEAKRQAKGWLRVVHMVALDGCDADSSGLVSHSPGLSASELSGALLLHAR
jgi:hypothetical protein